MRRRRWTYTSTTREPVLERQHHVEDHRIVVGRPSLEDGGLADGSPYVFPGRTSTKLLSRAAFQIALRRVKYDAITTHGFRSAFRDWAAERTNVPPAVCEAALAHALRDKTEAAYHRTDLFDRRRELMDTWVKFATAKPADVVAIRA